jgi:type I restriction enzyme M protein
LTSSHQVNLDIFWLRDESLEETANLPEPDVLAEEMLEYLESAVELLRGLAADLGAVLPILLFLRLHARNSRQ